MRAAVIILVGLGVVAAVCAVVLVRLVARPSASARVAGNEAEVDVLLATKALPAMTVVDAKMVAPKKVKKTELPKGALTNSVQVVGKVLMRPMVEGEAFSESSFASDGVGVYLAAAVPAGKRAVSVVFRDHSAMSGLLYPGSIVDVLVSVQPPGGEGREAIATTLLQGVQVMAIGSQSITSEQEYKDKKTGALSAKSGQSVNTRQVTLLVTPKQAEVLQLATQYGFVSLTMRNPLDTEPVAQEMTRISEYLSSGADRNGTNILAAFAARLLAANAAAAAAPPTTAPTAAVATAPPTTAPAEATASADPAQTPEETNPLWEMLIIRGSTSETWKFPIDGAAPFASPGPRASNDAGAGRRDDLVTEDVFAN